MKKDCGIKPTVYVNQRILNINSIEDEQFTDQLYDKLIKKKTDKFKKEKKDQLEEEAGKIQMRRPLTSGNEGVHLREEVNFRSLSKKRKLIQNRLKDKKDEHQN